MTARVTAGRAGRAHLVGGKQQLHSSQGGGGAPDGWLLCVRILIAPGAVIGARCRAPALSPAPSSASRRVPHAAPGMPQAHLTAPRPSRHPLGRWPPAPSYATLLHEQPQARARGQCGSPWPTPTAASVPLRCCGSWGEASAACAAGPQRGRAPRGRASAAGPAPYGRRPSPCARGTQTRERASCGSQGRSGPVVREPRHAACTPSRGAGGSWREWSGVGRVQPGPTLAPPGAVQRAAQALLAVALHLERQPGAERPLGGLHDQLCAGHGRGGWDTAGVHARPGGRPGTRARSLARRHCSAARGSLAKVAHRPLSAFTGARKAVCRSAGRASLTASLAC